VEDHHKQPYGLVHGGVFATLAEGMCSAATYGAVINDGMTIMGQANATTFLRPISEGHVNAVARPRHRGRIKRAERRTLYASGCVAQPL
jgi:1,4-dihydroxy-2-naphthoyl-CoA hydrolase